MQYKDYFWFKVSTLKGCIWSTHTVLSTANLGWKELLPITPQPLSFVVFYVSLDRLFKHYSNIFFIYTLYTCSWEWRPHLSFSGCAALWALFSALSARRPGRLLALSCTQPQRDGTPTAQKKLQSTEAGMQRIAAYWETEWEGSMPPKGKDTLKPDKDVAHQ